jgi:hypothetical protein
MAKRKAARLVLRLRAEQFAYLLTLVRGDLAGGGCPPDLVPIAEDIRARLERLVPGVEEP